MLALSLRTPHFEHGDDMEEQVAASSRPDDLITAREAATYSDKGLSTIRNWVRKGLLTGYRLNPVKSNSALLISTHELRCHLAQKAQPTHENNKGRPSEVSTDKSGKLEELQTKVAHLETQLAMAHQMIAHQEKLIGKFEKDEQASRQTLKDMQARQNDMSKTLENAHARTEQLLTYQALPWWQKMKSRQLLTG